MIDISRILELQQDSIVQWHKQLLTKENSAPWSFIEENTKWNFLLWHEEDIARIRDIDPLRIVEAKRNIDRYNQARNNAMEIIDEWILQYLIGKQVQAPDQIHSETPGMMIDRLSILQLKKYHMQEETLRTDATEEHKAICKSKVQILDEQIGDLATCLSKLFEQLEDGSLRFKVYRQLKMYNDPSLNPQLYNRAKVSQ